MPSVPTVSRMSITSYCERYDRTIIVVRKAESEHGTADRDCPDSGLTQSQSPLQKSAERSGSVVLNQMHVHNTLNQIADVNFKLH
jgi:hypothetical protein